MLQYKIDVSNEPDYMKGYHLVKKLYDIRDTYLFSEDQDLVIEYNELLINKEILDIIDEINFVYIKNFNYDAEEVNKVGNLLNFIVYLDPKGDNIIKMFAKGEKMILIEIIL